MQNSPSNWIPVHIQKKAGNSLIYLILISAVLALSMLLYRGGVRLVSLEAQTITIHELPEALGLSTIRMLASLAFSILFGFALGLPAALTRWGERIIIPVLDILQSIPVVGFFPAAITFFITLTQGHRLGVELAACFLIFTSQAWNIAFAVYEAVKGIPEENRDAVNSFGIVGSARFLKLYGPVSIPRLVYNCILSWSNGWFFLVACEIIAVGPVKYHLPGIGSFLAQAAEQEEIGLILWGLLALTLVILFFDFLVWRPISFWSEKFKQEQTASENTDLDLFFELPRVLLLKLQPLSQPLLQLFRAVFYPVTWTFTMIIIPLLWDVPAAIARSLWHEVFQPAVHHLQQSLHEQPAQTRRLTDIVVWSLLGLVAIISGILLIDWLSNPWPDILKDIPIAILASTGRLCVALGLCLLWILPVVLYTWNKPRLRRTLTTIAQIGASLPAIALFPLIIVVAVKRFGGGMELASIILLLNGMQWYVLFNCIGGTSAIPKDLSQVIESFGLPKVSLWKKLVLPAIRPALITGAITAWGGGWNALIVSEYVAFKSEVLSVNGIGALLNRSVYELGDSRAITLCIVAMVAWILLINTLFWRPIYQFAIDRYKFES